jgi:hypothetical protein
MSDTSPKDQRAVQHNSTPPGGDKRSPARKSGAYARGAADACELRNNAAIGAGWDVMQLENGEPLFSRRCGNEQIARNVAEAAKGSVTNRLDGELTALDSKHGDGCRPSTTVEERRILRELQEKLRVPNDDIMRLTRLGDAESLRLMREHLNTRDQVQAAYNELRERIDRRLKFPG